VRLLEAQEEDEEDDTDALREGVGDVSILVTAASTESDEADGVGAFPFPPPAAPQVTVATYRIATGGWTG